MFFVFNKDKAISYVVTLFTIVVLFFTASIFKDKEESIETSANETKINNTQNNLEKNNIENNELVEENKN